MKYLVTGGAGFIGSHLADYLIAQGHEVHAYDNFSTGSMENIAHLRGHDAFSLTIGNVLDYHTLEGALLDADRVVHLAAAVGVKLIMEQPVETIVSNVQGSENVLKLSYYHKKRVLIASTSEVYGKTMQTNNMVSALSEDHDLTFGSTKRRRWAYAASKALDEFLARAYYDEKGVEVVVPRFFNTVGPRQTGRYGMVIPRFVKAALSGEPIVIHGDGEQTRCFTHVRDAVRVIVELLETPKASGEIVNIGQPESVSVNELASRIIARTESSSPIRHVPYEEVYGPGYEDMQHRTPDTSLLRELVGFVPDTPLDDILSDVVASYAPAQAS